MLRRRRTARAYVPPHPGTERSAESLALLTAEHQAVVSALGDLAPRQREVLVLRYYGGLSEAEIAEATGLSKGNREVHRQPRGRQARRDHEGAVTRPQGPADPGGSDGPDGSDGPGGSDGSDPERVLAQALRALAGGGKQGRTDAQSVTGPVRTPFTVVQIMLIATILGVLVGMTVGLITLLA